jgi:hypothetical protein
MTLGLAFWILMLLWLVLGFWWAWPAAGVGSPTYHAWFPFGGTLLIFALFFLVGWKVFGPPIHGS